MSETAFLLCTLAMLASLDEKRAPSAGGWLSAAAQLRPAAVSLFPAAAAGFVRRRDWKGLAWAAGLPAALYGAWAALSALILRRAPADAGKLAYEGRSWAAPLAAGLSEKALFYARALGGGFLPVSWADGWQAPALGLALMTLAAYGCARALKRRWDDPAALALAGTAALYAAWAWQYERYWITALPLVLWAAAQATGKAARYWMSALLVLELCFGAAPWVRGTSWRTPELARTYAWLSANVEPREALASALYVRDGFLSGHPGTALPDTETTAEFAAQLRAQRVRYALWVGALDIGTARGESAYLKKKLARAGEHLRDASIFDIVYSDAEESSAVYRLRDAR